MITQLFLKETHPKPIHAGELEGLESRNDLNSNNPALDGHGSAVAHNEIALFRFIWKILKAPWDAATDEAEKQIAAKKADGSYDWVQINNLNLKRAKFDDLPVPGSSPRPKLKTTTSKKVTPIKQSFAGVKTPYEVAKQAQSKIALNIKTQVENGGKLYRIGTTNKSHATEAQFWAPENPLTNPEAFARKYNIPVENIKNANFIEIGTIKPGTNFVTRPAPAAPGSQYNPNAGIEVVTPAGGVDVEVFSIINQGG